MDRKNIPIRAANASSYNIFGNPTAILKQLQLSPFQELIVHPLTSDSAMAEKEWD